MKDGHVITAFLNATWAILPEKLHAIAHVIAAHAKNIPREILAFDVERSRESAGPRPLKVVGGVAVIPIFTASKYSRIRRYLEI